MTGLSVKVARRTEEALDIASFELVSLDGAPLPPFSAGAHIDVQVKEGLVRQYSLCNDARETQRYVIGVLRDPKSRGGSVAMHDGVREGDVLRISAPKNHFPLAPSRRTLLFAGGIGITPILCMAEQLAHSGADFELHYCTREPARAAFHGRLLAPRFGASVHLHFDCGAPAQKLDLPTLLATPDPDTHIYVCGPGGFIDHVVNSGRAQGWNSAQVHLEHFSAKAQDKSADTAFNVKIASSGKTYCVPAGRTVASVLADNGVTVPTSCEEGVCGTCITRVLDGVPAHRDAYFTDDERARNDQFTPCVSRALSNCLVLDL
ncbi:2Fe-2S iron-sulfur cluster binding domain-containing protein [Duganella sp. FT92W]|uniref:2Fe-2S iron-sulfur cluster binding domain-containing protein n=1 Tax=Pseudoduganella rivuli TaxID=2666085 RepID=A0A7X2ILC3_9BURK|nr:PDR/VanB family oxidoreductase [Pseudoduganella rivuli]MRV71662.1 2Fe-2S iron-sulfur cluster binding domain-containing protein [Pseudoduganella rivuli]